MSQSKRIVRAVLAAATLVSALAWPLRAGGQQPTAYFGNTLGDPDAVMARFQSLMEAAKPGAPNPFQQPWSVHRKAGSDNASDGLSLQADHAWTMALAQYDFTAPPEFYSFAHTGAGASDWDSALTVATTAYLSHSYTTYVRATGSMEIEGQRRDPGAAGEPGTQTFATQLEAAHLLGTWFGPMEVASGIYQQRLVAQAAYANSPVSTTFLGYSGSATGFETSLTLPDKNFGFTFRQGTEHANGVAGRVRSTQFGLSWTW
jgi:hypothetical protein